MQKNNSPKTSPLILVTMPLLTALLALLIPASFRFTDIQSYLAAGGLALIPSFLFALVCYKLQFHRRNVVQILFYSGAISFIFFIILFSYATSVILADKGHEFWENTLGIFMFSFAFMMASQMYAMLLLRLLLPKFEMTANT